MENTYVFRLYDKKYKKYFSFEKRKLLQMFPNVNIEHIGSTSVATLGGKGIVDIIISVPKFRLTSAFHQLEKKYTFDAGGGSDERYFFRKAYAINGKKRFVHLHLTFHNSREWHLALAFRDILRKDPALQKKYATLKKKACRVAKGDGPTYRKYKNAFIRSALHIGSAKR